MTIEEAIRAKLLTMSAVTALTTTIRIAEYTQEDAKTLLLTPDTCLIVIFVISRNYLNEVSGTCNLVDAMAIVGAVAKKRSLANDLADAIKTNGTNPGTGLAGIAVRTGDLHFDAMLVKDTSDVVRAEDGSDTGLISTDSQYSLFFPGTV